MFTNNDSDDSSSDDLEPAELQALKTLLYSHSSPPRVRNTIEATSRVNAKMAPTQKPQYINLHTVIEHHGPARAARMRHTRTASQTRTPSILPR